MSFTKTQIATTALVIFVIVDIIHVTLILVFVSRSCRVRPVTRAHIALSCRSRRRPRRPKRVQGGALTRELHGGVCALVRQCVNHHHAQLIARLCRPLGRALLLQYTAHPHIAAVRAALLTHTVCTVCRVVLARVTRAKHSQLRRMCDTGVQLAHAGQPTHAQAALKSARERVATAGLVDGYARLSQSPHARFIETGVKRAECTPHRQQRRRRQCATPLMR